MDWKIFWNQRAADSNEFRQVARIVHGKEQTDSLLEKIANNIISQLDLNSEDNLLDLCCGNGLLTNILAKHCKAIDAVDLSNLQIREAQKKFNSGKIHFIHSDALTYSSAKKYDKILLYFSFQYFDTFEKGEKLLENIIRMSHPDTIILLGDIPDKNKINIFYPKITDRLKYYFKNFFLNSDMGKFWSQEELDSICKKLKVKGRYIAQESWQPYSHYRYDYLIEV